LNLIDRIKNDFSILPDLIESYEKEYDEAVDIIKINEGEINEANRRHAGHQLYYDQKKVELHSLVKFMDMKVNVVKSSLYVSYTQTHDRDLTETGKKTYIEGESAYLDMYQLSLEVKELHEKYQALGNAFQSRGYAINNLTKLAIASIEDISY